MWNNDTTCILQRIGIVIIYLNDIGKQIPTFLKAIVLRNVKQTRSEVAAVILKPSSSILLFEWACVSLQQYKLL